jgi:hypothetical protein
MAKKIAADNETIQRYLSAWLINNGTAFFSHVISANSTSQFDILAKRVGLSEHTSVRSQTNRTAINNDTEVQIRFLSSLAKHARAMQREKKAIKYSRKSRTEMIHIYLCFTLSIKF